MEGISANGNTQIVQVKTVHILPSNKLNLCHDIYNNFRAICWDN